MARKRSKKKAGIIFPLLFALLFVIIGTMWTNDSKGNRNLGNDNKTISVQSGSSTQSIAQSLKESGIIRYPLFFRLSSKLGGHDGSYQLGGFSLNGQMSYKEIINRLKSHGTALGVKVTIPEGFELRQIADRLEENGLIDRSVFYDLIENEPFDYDFVKDLPKRENRLEGYLFPDTYFFEETDSERSIIDAMLRRFQEVYSQSYSAKAKELNMTTDEIITLASVVEREALGESDRALVAGVFHNRLKDTGFPYLQSCATVQYILKERKAVLSEADTKIDSPYNTYQNKGLPLGPIASPGKASIEAALYPAKTDYLFFVLDSSGKHLFSKTYEEHLKNAKK